MIKFLSKEYFIRSLYAFYSGLVHSICYGVCMQISYAVVLIWAKRECHRAYATENAKKKIYSNQNYQNILEYQQ